MTGLPAETWRKFKFATPPDWAYALLILICVGGLGFIAFAIVMSLIAQRASGYLPLTRSASRTVSLAVWIPIGLLIAAPVAWVTALFAGASNANTIGIGLLWLGILFLLAGLVGRLLVTRLVCPRAKVMEAAPGQTDRIVELRNVHPNFVTAINQVQLSRVAPSLQVPTRPGSN